MVKVGGGSVNLREQTNRLVDFVTFANEAENDAFFGGTGRCASRLGGRDLPGKVGREGKRWNGGSRSWSWSLRRRAATAAPLRPCRGTLRAPHRRTGTLHRPPLKSGGRGNHAAARRYPLKTGRHCARWLLITPRSGPPYMPADLPKIPGFWSYWRTLLLMFVIAYAFCNLADCEILRFVSTKRQFSHEINGNLKSVVIPDPTATNNYSSFDYSICILVASIFYNLANYMRT